MFSDWQTPWRYMAVVRASYQVLIPSRRNIRGADDNYSILLPFTFYAVFRNKRFNELQAAYVIK